MSSDPAFVHLRVHTEYSLVDGIVRIKPLIKAVAGQGMPAVAVTDVCNFFALVKFYKAAMGAGIKPICGADFQVQSPLADGQPSQLTLLVQDNTGYRNLTALLSKGYLEARVQGRPTVRRGGVAARAEGGLARSGGRHGDVGRGLLGGTEGVAENLLAGWKRDFPGRYYRELI